MARKKIVGIRLDDVERWYVERLATTLDLPEATIIREALKYYATEGRGLPSDRKDVLNHILISGFPSDQEDYHPGR
jgi:hypothetical protein